MTTIPTLKSMQQNNDENGNVNNGTIRYRVGEMEKKLENLDKAINKRFDSLFSLLSEQQKEMAKTTSAFLSYVEVAKERQNTRRLECLSYCSKVFVSKSEAPLAIREEIKKDKDEVEKRVLNKLKSLQIVIYLMLAAIGIVFSANIQAILSIF